MEIKAFNSIYDMNNSVVNLIMDHIHDTVKLGGNIAIGLSGGSTPISIYTKLNQLLLNNSTILSSIYFYQIDERFVRASSDRSNRKMILKTLKILKNNKNSCFIKSSDEIDSLENAVLDYNKRMENILQKCSRNIAILGMGSDAHTASLFPNNKKYIEMINLNSRTNVIGLFEQKQKETRISVSPYFISRVEYKIVVFTGTKKYNIFKKAITSNDIKKYPILLALDKNSIIFSDINSK